MHASALVLVLLSAVLHAAWNAQLKSGKDQAQFMASMSLAVATISLLCVPLVGLPGIRSWPCIVASGALHILYNFLLLQKYKNTDFSSAFPISRGVSPILVTLGALLFIHQRLALPTLLGVGVISGGILLQITGKNRLTLPLAVPAFATGATIAAYTVVDTIGVQRSNSTASYTIWVFASYLFVPPSCERSRCRYDCSTGRLCRRAHSLVCSRSSPTLSFSGRRTTLLSELCRHSARRVFSGLP